MEASLKNLLNAVADKLEEENVKKQADHSNSEKQSEDQMEKNQESGAAGEATLEDLVGSLHSQIKNSDWLQKNSAEKWTAENPELAKEYMEAMKNDGGQADSSS